jgi:hypothetical protein
MSCPYWDSNPGSFSQKTIHCTTEHALPAPMIPCSFVKWILSQLFFPADGSNRLLWDSGTVPDYKMSCPRRQYYSLCDVIKWSFGAWTGPASATPTYILCSVFSYIATLHSAILQHRNPAPAGTFSDSCGVWGSNKRNTLLLYLDKKYCSLEMRRKLKLAHLN